MSEPVVIRAEGIGKRYRIGQRQRYKALRDSIAWLVRAPLGALGRLARGGAAKAASAELFWALEEVSFEVRRGDAVGLIGRNGAGKSTLLKILSRITEPTAGRIEMRGRVGSLLEVGTGFHPELSGRENIFLYGAILGMKRREILAKFDQIVDFSETGRFLDMPVKHYSSGMYTRLAFSVAAHLEPEILLVDEVLAVGDAAFQKKCLGRMDELARGGRTVIFVSHTMGMIRQLCSHCLRLDGGRLVAHGPAPEVIDGYLKELYSGAEMGAVAAQLAGQRPDPSFELLGLRVLQDRVETSTVGNGRPVDLELEYRLHHEVEGFHVYVQLTRRDGTLLFESLHDGQIGHTVAQPAGHYLSRATIPADLLRDGTHIVTVQAGIHNLRRCLDPPVAVAVDVLRDGRVNSTYPAYDSPGLLLVDLGWSTRELRSGRPWPDPATGSA